MKNVLIYNRLENNLRYTDDVLINSLKAQVDNSLRFGWSRNDIIIGTNFDFEYNGVKNYELKNVCYHNPFYNKFYGMLELMESGILVDDFWFHDQDAWQISNFNFPLFNGELAGCTYVYTPEWNTCSMFIKKTSINIIRYIVEFMEINKDFKVDSDENMISILRRNSDIVNYFHTINNKYNVGRTHMEDRYNASELPVCVIGFQPQVDASVRAFTSDGNRLGVNLIDKEFSSVLETHFKEYKEKYSYENS
jgi:hypothetical protein